MELVDRLTNAHVMLVGQVLSVTLVIKCFAKYALYHSVLQPSVHHHVCKELVYHPILANVMMVGLGQFVTHVS